MKRGIALQGGGGKGSYQIGVWRALQELGLNFHGVVGTSVGAINGAMMAQGDLPLAEALWRSISPERVIAWQQYVDGIHAAFAGRPFNLELLSPALSQILAGGGLDISPLEAMLRQHIDENKLRHCHCEYGLCTVAMPHFQPKLVFLPEIPRGQLIDYIIASASLPIFEKKQLSGTTHIDGGFFDNFPVNMLYEKNYQEIIAVALFPKLYRRLPAKPDCQLTVIKPREPLGGILDFSAAKVAWRIELGYTDAMHRLAGALGRDFCFLPPGRHFDVFAFFNSRVSATSSLQCGLGFGDGDSRRIFFEKIIPLAATALGIESKASYEGIFALILEHAANKAGLEKLRLWNFPEMIRTLQRMPEWMVGVDFPDKSSLPILNEVLAVTTAKEAFLDALAAQLLS